MLRLALLVSTCGYIGHIPIAPGTFGSLPGLALTLGLRSMGVSWLESVFVVLLFISGTWAATRAERHYGHIDPGPVVIDEVLGMMVTLLFVPVGWRGAIAAFFVFRACDIVKPFPARALERLPGGLGVMSDDLMAGVWGNLAMHALVWALPRWMQ